MPHYFDVHAHVNFPPYEKDRDEVITRALESGVHMMNIGTDLKTSKEVVALAEDRDGLYASIALHPVDSGKEDFNIEEYEKLARHEKVKAIGECGLDYFRGSEEEKEKQKEVFIQHIKLANKVGKPLMLHIRNAYQDAIDILKEYAEVKGDVHFFAGTWEEAQQFIDFGFTVSFTGVITFTDDYNEVIQKAPLDMILSETDCPYVTPTPHRGKRNEPVFVIEVAKKIAEIRGEDEEEVRKQLVANAQRVFGFK